MFKTNMEFYKTLSFLENTALKGKFKNSTEFDMGMERWGGRTDIPQYDIEESNGIGVVTFEDVVLRFKPVGGILKLDYDDIVVTGDNDRSGKSAATVLHMLGLDR